MVNYKNSVNLENTMDNSKRNGLIYLMLFIMGFLFLANFSSAVNLIETKTDIVRQGDVYIVKQYCVNSTYANISFINLASQNILGQTAMVEVSEDNYQYNFTNTSILGIYSLVSYCDENGIKRAGGQDFEVTPTGKVVNDVGQISTSLIYLFLVMGFGFVLVGYLFLKNDSLWVSYSGIFLMLVGCAFLYYDLHLGNLYASTIAVNSGAENVTSGAFVMVAKFLKIVPLIIAGIIAFMSVKVLKQAIKKKKSNDGWDDNNY